MNSFSNVGSFIRGDLRFGCTLILLDIHYFVRRNISVDRSSWLFYCLQCWILFQWKMHVSWWTNWMGLWQSDHAFIRYWKMHILSEENDLVHNSRISNSKYWIVNVLQSNKNDTKVKFRTKPYDTSQLISAFQLGTFHFNEATFQERLHMEYISYSWIYDIQCLSFVS